MMMTWLNVVQQDANAITLSSYQLRRAKIARGHGAAQRSVGLRDDDNDEQLTVLPSSQSHITGNRHHRPHPLLPVI